MAEMIMGLPADSMVTVNSWDELPDAIKVSTLGIGNKINGTPWTLAELEAIQDMSSDEMIAAGYLAYNDAQKKSMLEQAKNIKSYKIDSNTGQINISQSDRGGFKEYTTEFGAALQPGSVGAGTNKEFQRYWGSAGNTSWGLTPTGEVVQTNLSTSGNESLDQMIQRLAAGLTTETGTVQGFGGRVFHYDRFGNYFESTGDRTASLAGQRALMGTTGVNAGGQFSNAFTGQRGTSVPADITRGTSPTAATYISPMGVTATTATAANAPAGLTAAQAKSQSAFEIFRVFLNQYGLGALAADVEKYKLDGLSDDELLIRLRTESPAYKRRFAANEARTQKGLAALSEAAYIGLEDQYQDVMRRYGLPESYYSRGELGRQEGFEKFISLDVSPVELEDRIQTAYNRVINANPEVGIALRNFYPGITNGDVLAYALDPNRALNEIQRKITAAEIGGAAVQAGLTTNESDAAYLARYGITKEQAQQGYRTISGYLPRAQQLSSIYGKQVEGGPYTQASAEREVFSTPGAAEEERKRQKITSLEQAAFSGSSGLTGGALGRERAGQF